MVIGLRKWDPSLSLKEKIVERVDWGSVAAGSCCWEWMGARSTSVKKPIGYGQIFHGGKRILATRASFEEFVGGIPAGMFVCHRCDNPGCVNPTHLFLGTARENTLDALAKGRVGLHPPPIDARGEGNGNAKLALADVEYIRQRYKPWDKEFSGGALARRFGVTRHAIYDVVRRKMWRHV